MYIVLGIIFAGLMMVCIFILGGLYTRHLMLDALDEARRQRMSEEYYRMAGVHGSTDPKPYIPPTLRPKAPRAKMMPGMTALERRLHEGKRGTIMFCAGDRNENVG